MGRGSKTVQIVHHDEGEKIHHGEDINNKKKEENKGLSILESKENLNEPLKVEEKKVDKDTKKDASKTDEKTPLHIDHIMKHQPDHHKVQFVRKEDEEKQKQKEKEEFLKDPIKASPVPVTDQQKLIDDVKHYQKLFSELRYEVSKIVVGQQSILNSILEAIFSNGNCLVEGIPGIAKTLLLKTLSLVTGCEFNRIQFTPDLLPTDIVGVTAYDDKKGFYTVKGPIFANFVLGDEINRAPPKVQSALLEGMQEKQVTIGKQSFPLPKPFFVMATQNPVEQMGTYPLPEAQIDRFLYKLNMKYPTMEEEEKILRQNTSVKRFDDYNVISILSPEDILTLQKDTKRIYLDPKIEKYIVRLVDATRNPQKYELELGKYVEFGSSPRASIGLYIAAKAHALISGKVYVTPQDVKAVAVNIFRHRMILNFEGQAENISNDDIVKELLARVPVV